MGKSDYIFLEICEREDEDEDYCRVPEHCWSLSYNREKGFFMLQNSSSGKVTKTENAENFLRIFIDDINNSIYQYDEDQTASVELYLKNEIYSQYYCNFSKAVPKHVIAQFITALKDTM